jgi:hypothetical protein
MYTLRINLGGLNRSTVRVNQSKSHLIYLTNLYNADKVVELATYYLILSGSLLDTYTSSTLN